MKLAVKFAYEGSSFHGSQRQGDDDTGSVEGCIVSALRKIDPGCSGTEWPIRLSSRTDAGVSALGNIFSVETEMNPDELLKALNANLDDIWCWGWGRPRPQQNIRWAASRWYRYHLPPGQVLKDDIEKLNVILSHFVGENDYTNFCKLEEEKNPVAVIERAEAADLSGNGELVIIDIVGSRFLWNQVRRMVGAALSVIRGEIEEDDILKLLGKSSEDPNSIKGRIRTMPPVGLILMDVHFKDIDFQISESALEVAIKRNSDSAWRSSMRVLLHTAMRSMQ
jgi:tRNA pseudouridine(38-40) synthase